MSDFLHELQSVWNELYRVIYYYYSKFETINACYPERELFHMFLKALFWTLKIDQGYWIFLWYIHEHQFKR